MKKKPKSVALVGTCPHCGESVEIIVSKKEIKTIFKAFKAGSLSEANLIGEIALKKAQNVAR